MLELEQLQSNEKEIIGNWKVEGAIVVADANSKRIDYLIENFLMEIAEDETGWIKLYQDPFDNRYWELTYQHGEAHGGGAPNLKNITEMDAKKKFSFLIK
jgi:Immunity protein 27